MRRVAESDEFQNAELDTGFIERHEHKLIPKTEAPSVADIASAAMVKAFRPPVASIDPFDLLTNWKVNQERVFFLKNFLNNFPKILKKKTFFGLKDRKNCRFQRVFQHKYPTIAGLI